MSCVRVALGVPDLDSEWFDFKGVYCSHEPEESTNKNVGEPSGSESFGGYPRRVMKRNLKRAVDIGYFLYVGPRSSMPKN